MLAYATRLLNHGPVTVLTTADEHGANACAVAWVMPLSKGPARFVLSLGRGHLSWEKLMATGEAVINIPGAHQAAETLAVGTLKGREVPDKIHVAGFATEPAAVVAVPRLAGCVAWLECRLVERALAEAHGLVILEAVHAHSAHLRDDGTLDVAAHPTLHHLGGRRFAADGEVITPPLPEPD
ncbi:MAG: flavin reductase family protein [Deltaproteobacteria bacterium]|nr:flavin reductase family protein [Deltaproteobacteria bacterium]